MAPPCTRAAAGGEAAQGNGTARLAALTAAVAYLLLISWYLLTHGGWPTPDYLIPPLLFAAIAVGRGWPFVFDWGPFLLLVLSWQATAGIAKDLGRPVHMEALVAAERWLFRGAIPTVMLQDWLFDPNRARWYDWVATAQHALHFVLPIGVGLVIWLRDRRTYWRYLLSLMVLFYLGFAGYALYPSAPPWLAGLFEVIPPVHRVAVETVLRLPSSAPIGLAYTHFSPNPVAAMPSLHAALPLLLALALARVWGRWALMTLLYPLTMGFNLVYLGEHYALDVLAGYAVALVAYGAVWEAPRLVRRLPAEVQRPSRPPLRPVLHGVPAWARGAMRPGGNLLLGAIALGSSAVILSTLRPDRPMHVAGPVAPGLQAAVGQEAPLAPVPCDEGASTSLTIGNMLVEVTGRYAVFLFDIDDGACYNLTEAGSFPPPRSERVAALAARAPRPLAPLSRLQDDTHLLALHAGTPAPALTETGLPPDHRYLLFVRLTDVADIDAARAAVSGLVALVIVEEPPPPEPEPALPAAPDDTFHVPGAEVQGSTEAAEAPGAGADRSWEEPGAISDEPAAEPAP